MQEIFIIPLYMKDIFPLELQQDNVWLPYCFPIFSLEMQYDIFPLEIQYNTLKYNKIMSALYNPERPLARVPASVSASQHKFSEFMFIVE